jgi:hypothetical protein
MVNLNEYEEGLESPDSRRRPYPQVAQGFQRSIGNTSKYDEVVEAERYDEKLQIPTPISSCSVGSLGS